MWRRRCRRFDLQRPAKPRPKAFLVRSPIRMMDQRALAHELARHHGRAQYRHRCRPACASTGGAHRSVHAWLGALYVVTTTALGSALGSSIQSRTSISSFSIVLSLHSVAQRFTVLRAHKCVLVCLVWVGACACVRVDGCACVVRCATCASAWGVRPSTSTSLLSLKPYSTT